MWGCICAFGEKTILHIDASVQCTCVTITRMLFMCMGKCQNIHGCSFQIQSKSSKNKETVVGRHRSVSVWETLNSNTNHSIGPFTHTVTYSDISGHNLPTLHISGPHAVLFFHGNYP